MQDVFMVAALVLLYTVPFLLAWAVIYSAVLAALRRHDRDIAERS